MKKTSKMTQPLLTAQALPAPQTRQEQMEVLALEPPHEPQALPALVPPQTLALPPPEGPQMQDVAAEEEQAPPAQDESSGSSASEPWEEPEDPHPPEKRVRTLSPEYDHAEELPKRTQCRC